MPGNAGDWLPSTLRLILVERLQVSAEDRLAAFRLADLLCCIRDFCHATDLVVQNPRIDRDQLRTRLSMLLFSGRKLADAMGDMLWLEALADAYADLPDHRRHVPTHRKFPHLEWENMVQPWAPRYDAVLGRVRFHLWDAYDDCAEVLNAWEAYQEGRIGPNEFFWGHGGLVQIQVHVRHHIVGLPNGDFAGLLVDLALAIEELHEKG